MASSSNTSSNHLPAVVLGVAGKIGAGKTTLCFRLSSRIGWPAVNLGNYLRSMIAPELRENRRALQELGASLVSNSLTEVCRGALNYAGWHPGSGLILDGIRSSAVVKEFRGLVAPTSFLLVFIETADSIREARFIARASTDITLSEADLHSMEQEAVQKLPEIADIVVRGDMPLEEEVEYVRGRILELTEADAEQATKGHPRRSDSS